MSLSFSQLHAKVESFYPAVQQVDDNVLRYTRTDEQSEFAVYYLDLGDELPRTPEKLYEYLDRVIGERYFKGSASLQWNNYLYFIRNPDQLKGATERKAKELVEQDRTYARKFVISDSELDSVLLPRTLQGGIDKKAPDATAPWLSILQEAHLVEAVFGDHAIPKRMRLIEKPGAIATSTTHPAKTLKGTLLPPIRQFEIKEFQRQYPIQRVFRFEDVNLLFGANGTGKTSLLEAIELFYCGKTRRNPKVSEPYRLHVSANGKTISVNQNRKLQPLRNNNLVWYGAREQRSTKLYDGFGRFNFLNTDAAIELSQSAERIDEDLAKLLVGSEAAKTWQIIEKLSERVKAELSSSEKLHKQVRQELSLINKQLSNIGTAKKESDSLRSALRKALARNQWPVDEDLDSDPGKLIVELAELKATSERAGSLSWLDSPVSLEIIESYAQTVESTIHMLAPQVENIKILRDNQLRLNENLRRDQKAMPLIEELLRLVESGVEQKTSKLEKHREIIALYSSLSSGIDEETLRVVAKADGNLTALSYLDSAVSTRKSAEEAMLVAKSEYEDFVKLRDHSMSLAQELRAVAARILDEKPSDECPLCHTNFQPGELAHRMALGVDRHLEEKAQKLLKKVRNAETVTVKATIIEKAANQIVSLCARMQLPPTTKLKDATAGLNESKVVQVEALNQVEALTLEIQTKEAEGLSLSRLNEVSGQLNALGFNLGDRSQAEISSLRNDVRQRLAASKRQMEANADEEVQIQASVSQAARSVRISGADPVAALAGLNERLATTSAVFTALNRFLPSFKWDGPRPIAEWMVEAEAVRGIANQLQTALENERLEAKTQSAYGQRKEELQKQDKELLGRVNRLDQAKKALTEIQTKHSLKTISETALHANRRSIETIFAQIHSPAEFEAIGSDWTLIRKLDNTKTPLTMISTGQRAAFALAVFLAQNAQLTAGPKVILIDDPIAHVDDLNCLSFLDYLREIALTGNRQIFFATASDKLAGLFERKFDFLGGRFKRFNLARAIKE